jgi:hypothetical protein
MRLSNVVLVLALGGFTAISTAVGCGGDDTTSNGSGGGSSGSSSSNSGSSSSGTAALPCEPLASCSTVTSECVALEDNKGDDSFALRMAQLEVSKPPSLAPTTIVGGIVAKGVQMDREACNLAGGGTFNLLLQFTKATNKLKVGGAKPVTDPSAGYAFLTETVGTTNVAPVEIDVTIDAAGKFTPAAGADIILPIYLAATDPTPAVLLPIHKALISGTLSDSNNCIGKFDVASLDPMKTCQSNVPFIGGADLDGFITLKEADAVIVTALNQSLCVILTGDPLKYGDGGKPNLCKQTTPGTFDFKGDWCEATNAAADATCADSVKLQGKLAASAVKLLP